MTPIGIFRNCFFLEFFVFLHRYFYLFNENSFDETGKYDVTATMQYISKQTGRYKMSVICHCAGCSSLFIALVTYPQLNDQCEVVVSIAPSVRLGYYRAPFLRHFIFRFYEPVKVFIKLHHNFFSTI